MSRKSRKEQKSTELSWPTHL